MIEINYESMLKGLIPKSYLTYFPKNIISRGPECFVHLDIPKSPEINCLTCSCDTYLLGQGTSSFEAWKDAYFNVVKKLTNG